MENKEIKILAIDDNQDNLISLKAMIKDAFPKAWIFTALNGQLGIEMAVAEEPDVILLDIVMPGMDGFEVCRRMKTDLRLNEIPVVFVTAIKEDKDSRIRALECGAEAFLAKPIDESELIAQIRAMVKIRSANIQKRDENVRLATLVEEKTYELRRTKEYLEKLIAYANAPIVVWNETLEITKCNVVFETLIGRTANELLGKNIGFLFPTNKLSETISLIENKRKCNNLDTTEIEIIHSNGSVRTVLWSLATIYDNDGINNVSTIAQGQDITDRIAAERKLMYLSYHDQLTGIYNRRFFEEELKRLDTKRNLPLSIVIGDINGLKLINDSFGHYVGDELLMKAGEILKNGCRADDIIARHGGDEFVILLPRTDTMEVTHIVERIKYLASTEKIANVDLSISFGYDTKENEGQTISEILANAENQMYRHKLYERSSMRSKTIDIIMNTLFEKSNKESLHSRRVSEICKSIASKMNLEKDDVSQIRIAGLVHDIGKIGIDEKILNKAGTLNLDERSEIEKHPETGWRILSSTNEFSELAQFILEHHEKWDGKGYPKGLKGEEISIEARIITVADAYDAMTSERSYRKGVSKEEAVEEIKRCSGYHFDPKIAKVFIEKVLGHEY